MRVILSPDSMYSISKNLNAIGDLLLKTFYDAELSNFRGAVLKALISVVDLNDYVRFMSLFSIITIILVNI